MEERSPFSSEVGFFAGDRRYIKRPSIPSLSNCLDVEIPQCSGIVTQFLRVSAGVTSIDDPESSLLRTYGIYSLECCSETAMNSIGIICRVASNESLLPVWWVSIYYGRLLALILIQTNAR